MGTCLCVAPDSAKAPPSPHLTTDTNHTNSSTSPSIHQIPILPVTQQPNITNHPSASTVIATPSPHAHTLQTYNAMVTRDRNLTNTSNNSNSTNYSSIEQLYEITSVPHTFCTDPKATNSSKAPHIVKKSIQKQIVMETHTAATEIVPLTVHKQHLPLPKRTLSTSHSVSSQTTMIASNTPPETPPIHPQSPSPALTAQYSSCTSLSSFTLNGHKPSSFTLSPSNATSTPWSMTTTERYYYPKTKRKAPVITSASTCGCHLVAQSVLDIVTRPSIWCMEHDDMLKYMLLRHGIPVALFEIFKAYVHLDGSAVLKVRHGAYHKRIRDGLRRLPFCPCWYDQYEHGLRVMQFGYCPGTTQFALKFTSKNTDKYHYASFESRSRFATNIRMDATDPRTDLGIEIFDMNIAEFPTMIPSYLESYSPHVILLLFDVADRSSFDGIIKMRKSLQNLYESLEEKTEYDAATVHPNRTTNLKRFHDSFDAIASVFRFGQSHHPSTKEKEKERSHSVASLLSNLSSSIKHNTQKQNEKRARAHTHLNRSNHRHKVNESNKNEFTIEPLNEGIEPTDDDENGTGSCSTVCRNDNVSCYYHDGCPSDRISSMPPILVVGIQADIEQKERNVSIEEAIELSKKWETPYIETSAQNGNNVTDVFIECVRTRWVYDTFPKVRMRSSAFLITE